MFPWSGWCIRRSLPLGLVLFAAFTLVWFACSLWAQEAAPENPNAGTIQGIVRSEDGEPVEAARISYSSDTTDTKGVTRTDKDGKYVTEQLPPGTYVVHVDGRDLLPADVNVVVNAGAAATVNFKLDWINPGSARLESRYSGDLLDSLPVDGRNYLTPGEIFPAVQAVDAAVYDPGKSGFQSLSIDSFPGRTTHYDFDEIEGMDETKGAAVMNLPADSIREVIISRVTPEVFQSLNGIGSVRVSTRSGGDAWHGDLFGNLRDGAVGLAGFPSGSSNYSRQLYGFGVGGPLVTERLPKGKAFLFFGGERIKQDGGLPMMTQDLILPSGAGSPAFNSTALRNAYLRQNMLTGRLDYNVNANEKFFVRLGYDNANQLGQAGGMFVSRDQLGTDNFDLFGQNNSLSVLRNQFNERSAAFGLDRNRGRFVDSIRVGYQKLVNAVTPDLAASTILASAPFQMQIGSFSLGPPTAGPRQTIQQDLFARWDSSTIYRVNHAIRFGAAYHYIMQGDYFAPGANGPLVTSSNGLATISATNGNSSLSPLYPGDPRGAADNPLNYPVGSITIFNGLGNFSENSAFGRPTGGHSDQRIEGYVADTINVIPNVNFNVGVNYVLDTGRTDSDLAPILCSSVTVSPAPCSGSTLLLNEYGLTSPNGVYVAQALGQSITRPLFNFAPQAGLAWDPGHNGRTVVRASGGMFYDNFLLQNTYQDRINRLLNGQYARSLTLCPTGSVVFPDGSVVSSVDGLDIASQICGQPIGGTLLNSLNQPVVVSQAIQDLQSDFMATQATMPASAANTYSLAHSLGDFGGMLAPQFKTPRVIHMSGGIERQIGERSTFSVDYVREIGTQFPLGIDTNHVGDANFLTDGDNPDITLNTYAAELSAINATLLSNPASSGCAPATFAGPGPNGSQAAVDCYITSVPTASIVDFARHGLDSSNAFCGPFACSVLGKQQAAFGGINPAVGSNIMYFPSGRSQYQGVHFMYHTSSSVNPMRRVQKIDVAMSYTLSRYRSNIAEPNGSGGDYSMLNLAEDYARPHLGHFGSSGFDRTHQLVFTPTVEFPRGPRLSVLALLASPLPLSPSVPELNGGGVPGEIFRSDLSGDGTVGDLLAGTYIGTTGRYSSSNVTAAIKYYNDNVAGHLTPAGNTLVTSNLFLSEQLNALGAYSPLISSCNPPSSTCGLPGRWAASTWLKTVDLRLVWPFAWGERLKIEPNLAVFNVFNFSNYGGPGNQLSGILDAAPGTSLNNSTSPGFCGLSTSYCTSRLDRVLPGSGTYSTGAPRAMQFGVRVTF